jgi:isopentenyl-diphosphate Delta-isomerase
VQAIAKTTMSTQDRKDSHIDVCLNSPVDRKNNFFDRLRFEHNALPELDFDDIDTNSEIFGKKIGAPIIITSMTGGTDASGQINRNLAYAAAKYKIPMGLGSQRIMLEKPESKDSFDIKKIMGDTPILANLGAVQLNYGISLKDCEELVQDVQADALCLHLNPLQEAIQPEGDRNFSSLLPKIEEIVKKLSVPVIIKEVGAGISLKVAEKLFKVGVRMIDISGSGGTSWAYIEGKRSSDKNELGELFGDWGTPTPIAIKQCSNLEGLDIIAGGGIRSGLDLAKAISLGAEYASIGLPLFKAAAESKEAAAEQLGDIIYQLKIAMFATASQNISELREQQLYKK